MNCSWDLSAYCTSIRQHYGQLTNKKVAAHFIAFALVLTSSHHVSAELCKQLPTQHTGSKTQPSLETLRSLAKKVKDVYGLFELLQQAKAAWLSAATTEKLLDKIKDFPDFISKREIVFEAYKWSKYDFGVYQKNFVIQGLKFLKEGGSPFQILKSQFLSEKMRLLVLDIGQVKRSRIPGIPLSPLEQMHIWETEYNDLPGYQRSSLLFPIEIKTLPESAVLISVSSEVPTGLIELFLQNGTVNIPIDPFNESTQVPFLDAKETGKKWHVFLTSSRSKLYIIGPGTAFSLKLPSDYTNPIDYLKRSPKKADMSEDVEIGLARSRHIEAIDRKIGKDPRLIILRDVLAISDPLTGNGFTVRDISPLLDGNFYISGNSILRVMAETNDVSRVERALLKSSKNQGRAQALLLIRYGLEMETPHRQNSLERLTDKKDIAETTVLRDVGDSLLVAQVANLIAREEVKQESNRGHTLQTRASANTQYVGMLYRLIPDNLLAELEKALIDSYNKTLVHELGIRPGISIDDPEFQKAIVNYHERKRKDVMQKAHLSVAK